MPSATYPRGGRGLEVDSGVGIRLGLISDLTPVPTDQKGYTATSDMQQYNIIPSMGIL